MMLGGFPLASLLLTFVHGSEINKIPLTLLTKEQSVNKGAVCLDGGPPGFYHRREPSSAPQAPSSWVLYFKGGGWCYTEKDCAGRAKFSSLGNSSKIPKHFDFSGILDASSGSSVFAGFHHVILWYCDGASFTGDRAEPQIYVDEKTKQATKLFFRGRRVLDAILDVLLDPNGPYRLDQATQVLVSGGSAGGLAAFHHADYIKSRLPKSVTKFRAAPVSGLFLLHASANGTMLYPDKMKYVFSMQNSTGGVHPRCVAAGHGWRCMFANYSYAYSSTHFFPLQSGIDSWQLGNILAFGNTCFHRASCIHDNIGVFNGYVSDMMADLRSTEKFHRVGEGGFIETCHEHVSAQSRAFFKYEINGVKEVDALSAWWADMGTEPSAKHWYLPCKLTSTKPYQCNPSCGAFEEKADISGPSVEFVV